MVKLVHISLHGFRILLQVVVVDTMTVTQAVQNNVKIILARKTATMSF